MSESNQSYDLPPKYDSVTKTFVPGIQPLEDKEPIQLPTMRIEEPEQYKYVHVVIGILVLLIIGAFFIGMTFKENQMLKIQIEMLQRGLVR